MSSQKKKATKSAYKDRALVASLVAAAESAVASPTAAPLKVTAVAAAAIALTAKDHALTRGQEEQLKTRLQYRLYQRNHRAKKQRHVQDLEGGIAALRDEIAELEATKQSMASRFAKQTIAGFVAAFRSVEDTRGDARHEQELRTILAKDARVEWVVRQWRWLCTSFTAWAFEIADDDVTIVHASEEDMAVLSCPTVLQIGATQDQLGVEFPALHEELLAALASRASIDIGGRVALIVEASTGLLVSMALDLDLVTSMKKATDRPLPEVERIVCSSRCLLSLSDTGGEPERIDPGDMEFQDEAVASENLNSEIFDDSSRRRDLRGEETLGER